MKDAQNGYLIILKSNCVISGWHKGLSFQANRLQGEMG